MSIPPTLTVERDLASGPNETPIEAPLRRSIGEHRALHGDTPKAAGRRHDLDALRGFAMLLGIGLHVALSFFPNIWPVQDQTSTLDGPYDELFHAVHGFRMPLFFLLSGFFTTMLWRRRGLRALLWHRFRRIVLPLAIVLIVLVPIAILATQQAFAPLTAVTDGDNVLLTVPVRDGGFTLTWLDNLGHLWFLWFLVWFGAGFAIVAAVLERLGTRRRQRVDAWPRWLMWSIVPFTLLGQWLMGERGENPVFGPDTSLGLIPLPHVFGYYALFFVFGALLFDRSNRKGEFLVDTLGRRWRIILPVAVLVVFPLALSFTFAGENPSWELATAAQGAYTWMMSIGLIGLFRSVFWRERRGVRYLSDASYWMYLAHIPLVIAAQMLVRDWNTAAVFKFGLICVTVSALLLITYQRFVRYTPIGTLLNGKRTRPAALDRRGIEVRVVQKVQLRCLLPLRLDVAPGALVGLRSVEGKGRSECWLRRHSVVHDRSPPLQPDGHSARQWLGEFDP